MPDDRDVVDAVLEAIGANATASRQYASGEEGKPSDAGFAAHHAAAVRDLADALHNLGIQLNPQSINPQGM